MFWMNQFDAKMLLIQRKLAIWGKYKKQKEGNHNGEEKTDSYKTGTDRIARSAVFRIIYIFAD